MINAYYAAPWVKPFYDWLKHETDATLVALMLLTAGITVAIALLAPYPVKMAWLIYLLSP